MPAYQAVYRLNRYAVHPSILLTEKIRDSVEEEASLTVIDYRKSFETDQHPHDRLFDFTMTLRFPKDLV
ncbi:hypothetical protein ElyMa_006572000, partial [Elysia marginata]